MTSLKLEDGVRYRAEMEALRRLGMKWTVLATLSYDLSEKGIAIPNSIGTKLRETRTMIESACFPVCDVTCSLDGIERELVPVAASRGKRYLDRWMKLLGRAMSAELTQRDVGGLLFAEPLMHDCEFLRCSCAEK